MSAERTPGNVVTVYQGGKLVYQYASGYADLESETPLTGNELFNIYSCSKITTVTAGVQLLERGAFLLSDPLYEYMPEFRDMYVRQADGEIVKAANPIRIGHLFTMTAGFSYDRLAPWVNQLKEDTDGRCPTREMARYLATEPLYAEPGTEYRYSLGHDVLAALVEVISGEKFEDYTRHHIFEPMGMVRTEFLKSPDTYDEIATHYVFKDGKAQLRSKWPAYRFGTEHASGGAGCVSTVEEYMKFLEGLRTFKLLKKETIDLICRDWLNESERQTFPPSSYHYGLGMRARNPGTDHADFGWGGAAGATLHIDIPHGISVFYVQHLISSPNQAIRPRVYTAVLQDLGFDVEVEIPHPDANNLTY